MYCTVDKNVEEKNSVQVGKRTITPFVNQYKSENGIVLVMDLPGVSEENLDISFEKDILSISANAEVKIPEEYKLTFKEYSIGKYFRRFVVGNKFDQEKTKAVFKNGRLTLTLVNSEIHTKKVAIKAE